MGWECGGQLKGIVWEGAEVFVWSVDVRIFFEIVVYYFDSVRRSFFAWV